jgi:hypothetical protein
LTFLSPTWARGKGQILTLRLDIIDISKYIREGFHAIELTNKDLLTSLYRDNLLFRNCLELLWSFNKPLASLVCELKYSDEVAYTEAKAHRGLECSVVVVV